MQARCCLIDSDTVASLASLAPEDAFRLAIKKSGKSLAQIGAELGWSESHMRKILSSESYYVSFDKLAVFCQVVGNTVVIDWLTARMQGVNNIRPELTPEELRNHVFDLTAGVGNVALEVKVALEDLILTKAELRSILRELLRLGAQVYTLSGSVREAERKVARHA